MKKIIMDEKDISRGINKLATDIVAYNQGVDNLVVLGIRTRGVPLSKRLAQAIGKLEGIEPEVGILDITLYRDDIGMTEKQPIVKKTEIPFNIFDKTLILVDDVLFTGRTIRAALDALMDFGRPKKIELCVLIDRGNRELPIRSDFQVKKITTKYEDNVIVHLKEIDNEDKVYLKEN